MTEESHNSKKSAALLLATIALGMFLDGLDGTIVNVALPDISASFGIDSSTASWIVTIYFLVLAGLVLIFGKLCDSGAIKKIVIGGFLIFTAGSLLCGLSNDIVLLLVSRVIQGTGAAMLAASAVMLAVKFLPPGKIGFGLALVVLGSSTGAAVGPALGGVLAEYLSWHWIFFINVPIGLVAAWIAFKALPSDSGFDRSSFDYSGALLLFASLVCGLYTLESLPSHGFTSVSVATLLLFMLLFSVFILHERRVKNPILDLTLFKIIKFNAVTVPFLLVNACYMGILYLIPFYMRVELGFDTIMTGMFLLISAVMTLIFCLWTPKASKKYGNRLFVLLGCFFLAAAMTLFALMDPNGNQIWVLAIGLAFAGMLWGLSGGPLGNRLIDNVPEEKKGSGSSMLSFFIYFGSALGTALFSGLFGFGSKSTGEPIMNLSPEVFMEGFTFAMIVGIILSVIAIVLSWAVKEERNVKQVSQK